MKESFRQSMAWLHTWTGLVAGWVLFFIFVTGTAGYFNFEIDRWMKPEWPLASQMSAATLQTDQTDKADASTVERQIAFAQSYLQSHHPHSSLWVIQLPVERRHPWLSITTQDAATSDGKPARTHRLTLDPSTGEFIKAREQGRATGGGQWLYRMHYLLHYMPDQIGILLVGVCTMLMLLALITGVITHKKIFTDFFTYRPRKGLRSWLDAHNVISVMALPFFLMITYSGLVFFMSDYMPAVHTALYPSERGGIQRLYAELMPERERPAVGEAAPLIALSSLARAEAGLPGADAMMGLIVRHPGDAAAQVAVRLRHEGGTRIQRTNDWYFDGVSGKPLQTAPVSTVLQTRNVLIDLHEGHFANTPLRWLYFLSGLLGCAMIATGLLLWTAKRKARQEKRLMAGQSVAFGYRLVSVLNVATLAGLPTAVACYFWANRLLPLDLPQRAAWEAHVMFLTWAAILIYALCRQPGRAWVSLLALAGFAFGFLPVLNALTTERHLGVTLAAGDAVLAGFDLTMEALGLVFAGMARYVWRREQRIRPAAKE